MSLTLSVAVNGVLSAAGGVRAMIKGHSVLFFDV